MRTLSWFSNIKGLRTINISWTPKSWSKNNLDFGTFIRLKVLQNPLREVEVSPKNEQSDKRGKAGIFEQSSAKKHSEIPGDCNIHRNEHDITQKGSRASAFACSLFFENLPLQRWYMTCELWRRQRLKSDFLDIHTQGALASTVFHMASGKMVGVPPSSVENFTFVLTAPSALAAPFLYQWFWWFTALPWSQAR